MTKKNVILYIVVLSAMLGLIWLLDNVGNGDGGYDDLDEYTTDYEDEDLSDDTEDADADTSDFESDYDSSDSEMYDGKCDICGAPAKYRDGAEEFCISCYADEIEECDEEYDDAYDDLEDY